MPPKTTNKAMTLNEFRAWLEGVQELQPKTWHPDAAQWKLIRNKINNITEPAPQFIEKEVVRHVNHVNAPPLGPPPTEMSLPVHTPNMSLNIPTETSLPVGEVPMTAAAKAALSGSLPIDTSTGPPLITDRDGRMKTPNIDTADGNYVSSLE